MMSGRDSNLDPKLNKNRKSINDRKTKMFSFHFILTEEMKFYSHKENLASESCWHEIEDAVEIQGDAVINALRWCPVNGEQAAGADENSDYIIIILVYKKTLLRRNLQEWLIEIITRPSWISILRAAGVKDLLRTPGVTLIIL